jgi:hypothetical protein
MSSAGRFLKETLLSCSILNIKNGTYRARTYDPLLVRQMLSQLS